MGNALSSHEGDRRGLRGPYKLSKPRTSHFTAAGLLSPSGPDANPQHGPDPRLDAPLPHPPSPAQASPAFPPASMAGEAPAHLAPGRRASLPSPTPTRERRRSLFRSKSSQGEVQRRNQRRNTVIGTSTPATTETNIARANSMTYESGHGISYGPPPADHCPPAGSRTSWAYDLNSYEAKRLLNIIDEPAAFELPTAAMSDVQASAASETAWRSPYPTQQPERVPISRANSDVSLYTPVRRRSVVRTPGVATRTATAPPVSSRSSCRNSHPPTPSMSRRGSFDSANAWVLSMPPPPPGDGEPMPRVATPCDGDYKTIGAFKLGSLRIVNGSPVLSPELSRGRASEESSSPEPRATDDYFFGARGGEPFSVRGPEDMAQDHGPLPRIKISPEAGLGLGPTAAAFAPDEEGAMASKEPAAPVIRGHEEFLVELAFSPFALDPASPTQSELQTTSKHTAMEDQLFEADDDKQPEYSTVEILDVRPDPNAKPPAARPAVHPTQGAEGVARSDSGVVSSPASESSRSQTLAKTDSGYSSSVSLRSFRLSAKPTFSNKEGRTPATERVPAKTQGEFGALSDQMPATVTVSMGEAATSPPPPTLIAPPPLPPKDQSPASPAPASASPAGIGEPAVPCGSPHIGLLATSGAAGNPAREASPSLNSDTAPHSPASVPLSPRSAASDMSTSTLSIGSGGSHRQGRLHRLLSFNGSSMARAKMPLTVHVTHAMDKTIPSVPRAVEAKLNEHTGLFPITTKRLALKTQLSKDTLKTIFSVGSVEVSKDESQPPLPPSPNPEEADEPRESHLRQALQSMPSTIAHAAASMIPSRRPITRKPVPSRLRPTPNEPAQPESVLAAEAALSTYMSVNDSLGSNAYDAAMSAMADGSGAPYAVQAPPARSMSMTTQLERALDMRASSSYSPSMPPIQASDAAEETWARKGRAPPISLNNRRPTSMRPPPPRRPQSTPPLGLYSRASRESLRSQQDSDQAARQPLHEDDDGPPPPIPPQNPRRSLELRRSQLGSPIQCRAPNWEVQTDHDAVPSRRNSMEQSRSGPLSPGHAVSIPRPASVQPHAPVVGHPSLTHRSSYDGFSYAQTPGSYPMHPPPPNRGPKLQHYAPWSDARFGVDIQPHGQHGQFSPHAPRAHHRNRSVDSSHMGGSGNPPYRVLHSYNSPAYKNAPIWG